MKWPNTVTIIRHGESAYNELKSRKEADPLYQEFMAAYENRRQDPDAARDLANELLDDKRFILGVGDHDTPLTERGEEQAQAAGVRLGDIIDLPDVIFVSPYLRTHQTLARMAMGWPDLQEVKTVEEERIREQEHGLTQLYNDWRIFNVMHPEQEGLRAAQGSYWYRYPQGENVPDMRERHRSIVNTFTRDYSGQNILMVGHHLSILSFIANIERMSAEGFEYLDKNYKPVNCGATIWDGNPHAGQDGKLELRVYNEQLYDDVIASR